MKRLPEGFVLDRGEGCFSLVRADERESFRGQGLHRPEAWDALLAPTRQASGRGGVARIRPTAARGWVLKRMRRGGLLAPLWRDRYLGTIRLLDNLDAPLRAARAKIPTAAPVGLLVRSVGWGLVEGWLAFEEIEGGIDLAKRFRDSQSPTRDELACAMALVREMHDVGIDHPDLNLGNLLLRGSASSCEAFVIDLDRATFHETGLGFGRRQKAIRRIERSLLKLCGPSVTVPWHRLYAAGDRALAERLERGRRVGKLWLRLHQLAWRR